MLPFRLDEITSKDTAVKTGSGNHGMASQACHDLHLVDSRLRLQKGSMYMAVESSKFSTGKAYQSEGFRVRTPEQQSNLTRKHCASKQTVRGATYRLGVPQQESLLANQSCSANMLH